MLRFSSVCSGIEAASVALEPHGFKAVGFAEIDPAASRSIHQNARDLSGMVSGRLTVICQDGKSDDGHVAWKGQIAGVF